MNIPYLLHILGTDKTVDLVNNIDLPLLDINLAIWDAEAAGQVEISEDKEKVTALVAYEVTYDADLRNKLLRIMQHHERQEVNITRGRLNNMAKSPQADYNHPYHEYIMALHSLIDDGTIIEDEMPVAANKTVGRPYHKFVFLCFPDNDNQEWNAKEVNNWLAQFEKKKVK